MRASQLLLVVFGLVCPLVVWGNPANEITALRETVLKAEGMLAKSEAYKKLFQEVGRAGLKDLRKDEDTSIALQAAWELSKKPVMRAKM